MGKNEAGEAAQANLLAILRGAGVDVYGLGNGHVLADFIGWFYRVCDRCNWLDKPDAT